MVFFRFFFIICAKECLGAVRVSYVHTAAAQGPLPLNRNEGITGRRTARDGSGVCSGVCGLREFTGTHTHIDDFNYRWAPEREEKK